MRFDAPSQRAIQPLNLHSALTHWNPTRLGLPSIITSGTERIILATRASRLMRMILNIRRKEELMT